MNALTHAEAAELSRWVGWAVEIRAGQPTKVPYSATRAGRSRAKANDPETWANRARAEAWAARNINGAGGGIGLQLGAVPERPGTALGGVDLDVGRDPETGALAPWAAEVVAKLGSYAEISPSRTGIKVYFTYATEDLATLRAAMGTDHGRTFKRGERTHPPAIELHISHRYFAWTGEHLDGTPADLRPVPPETLLWLVREAGPAFAAGGRAEHRGDAENAPDADDALMARLRAAMDGGANLASTTWALSAVICVASDPG
jgi:putative DNA primase/helicase